MGKEKCKDLREERAKGGEEKKSGDAFSTLAYKGRGEKVVAGELGEHQSH